LKLQVVAPCNVSWDNMPGGDDIRFCGQCRQNVYNLSEMTETQVRELVQGPACVRFFARGDGTVITKECPSMLQAARRRVMAMAAGLLPMAAAFWGSVAWLRGKVHTEESMMMGAIAPRVEPLGPIPTEPPPVPIRVDPPRPIMGEPAPLMGKPSPPSPPRRMGRVRAPKVDKKKKETPIVQ
jgi:hypothetical protein